MDWRDVGRDLWTARHIWFLGSLAFLIVIVAYAYWADPSWFTALPH